ncbi:AP-1-like transcription factor [Leucoagaricus sp. SymC.cos]|nr:AP-1-like transcription factor [Leucoagaricus sp. SymC.cos]
MSTATSAVASSSTTLWATASKEWVIQPKPKPGRKPKKDTAPTNKDEDESDAKGRRVQNRAAQRAFRERKQSQLAELQARIQQYEQGEIERNVALQNIAKRLKEENESLRRENALLTEKISKLEKEQQVAQEKKRWRDNSPASVASRGPARKKSRLSPELLDKPLSASYTSYMPSPPSMVNSPDSTGTSESRFSPIYEAQSSETTHPIMSNIELNHAAKPITLDPNASFPSFDCGFCSDDTPCVCRELAAQQAADRSTLTTFKSEDYTPSIVIPSTRVVHLEPAPQPQSTSRPSSILDNLPAYQPPVPLRRRATPGMVNSIFPVQVLPEVRTSGSSIPQCTGDPSNCLACADDAFGKAFCSAIEKTVAARPPCSGYSREGPSTSCGCCGGQADCEHCSPASSANPSSPYDSSDTIPTNDAWRQIKVHPNVSFADLSLLANVVASRSKCTGPRVMLSPHPEHRAAPAPPPPPAPPRDNETIILTDPHAQYREKEKAQLHGGSSPQLVSQDVLVQYEPHRVCEVPTSAVRDALRILDAKFP